ncbi:MAG: hypothetical protein OCD01_14945 [Fibrobacterales bacterium]
MMLRIFELIAVLVGVFFFNRLIKKSIEKDVDDNPASAVNKMYRKYEVESDGIEEDAIR